MRGRSMSRTPVTCARSTSGSFNLEQLLVFKAPRKDDPQVQSGTTTCFLGCTHGRSTSRIPPTRGQSTSAMRNNSSFLRFQESVGPIRGLELILWSQGQWEALKTAPGDLVMPDPFGWFFSQNSLEVGWFFLSQEVGWFFFPERLGDFVLSREIG